MKHTPRPAIRVGIGGWTFDEWRDNFYPADWPRSRELDYASRHLSAIEINSTYHGTQKPASFAKWRDETPDDFVFSVKASRFATNRRVLAEAGESIERFIGSGLAELGAKLGPIVWQFAPTKRFEAEDFGAFLALLPKAVDGITLRHALDVRHPSFMCAEYLALARHHAAATVFADSDDYPSFANPTGKLVYARLMGCAADEPLGYTPESLDRWAARAAQWAEGGEPADLPRIDEPKPAAAAAAREVYVFFISGAKARAPHAAMGLIERMK
jgi:uncharacterized protein YecE (DUF72 family)